MSLMHMHQRQWRLLHTPFHPPHESTIEHILGHKAGRSATYPFRVLIRYPQNQAEPKGPSPSTGGRGRRHPKHRMTGDFLRSDFDHPLDGPLCDLLAAAAAAQVAA